MSDILLAIKDVEPGTIDLTVGEPHTIKKALFENFDVSQFKVFKQEHGFWEYQKPNGYGPLVSYLEKKHNAPVIITNGAKNGLASYFYACSKMGLLNIGMKLPYWALIPPLAKELKCNSIFCEPESIDSCDSYLLLAPNNPDGQCEDSGKLSEIASLYSQSGKIFAHDAAYYTHSYLPQDYELKDIGDIQIYSGSKMFGLSSIRVGYVVCKNKEMYNHMCHYMETFSVGVSSLSQKIFLEILKHFDSNLDAKLAFEQYCRDSIAKSKEILSRVNPNVIVVPEEFSKTSGMFGWVKVLNKEALASAKINVLDGSLFGMDGYARLNLSFEERVWLDLIERLKVF